MVTHRIFCRVIYGDTDCMGIVYYAQYLRWFEMGRTEMFRLLGLTYADIESKGIVLPVSEVYCKYLLPARYDDMLIIETLLNPSDIRAGMRFEYRILRQSDEKLLVSGYTRHACITPEGRVVRPPQFIKELVAQYIQSGSVRQTPEEK